MHVLKGLLLVHAGFGEFMKHISLKLQININMLNHHMDNVRISFHLFTTNVKSMMVIYVHAINLHVRFNTSLDNV